MGRHRDWAIDDSTCSVSGVVLLRRTRRRKASCVQLHGGLLRQGVSHVKHTAQDPRHARTQAGAVTQARNWRNASTFLTRSASTLNMLADRLQTASMALECKSEPYGLLADALCNAFNTVISSLVDSANSSSEYGSLSLFSGWWIEFRM